MRRACAGPGRARGAGGVRGPGAAAFPRSPGVAGGRGPGWARGGLGEAPGGPGPGNGALREGAAAVRLPGVLLAAQMRPCVSCRRRRVVFALPRPQGQAAAALSAPEDELPLPTPSPSTAGPARGSAATRGGGRGLPRSGLGRGPGLLWSA